MTIYSIDWRTRKVDEQTFMDFVSLANRLFDNNLYIESSEDYYSITCPLVYGLANTFNVSKGGDYKSFTTENRDFAYNVMKCMVLMYDLGMIYAICSYDMKPFLEVLEEVNTVINLTKYDEFKTYLKFTIRAMAPRNERIV